MLKHRRFDLAIIFIDISEKFNKLIYRIGAPTERKDFKKFCFFFKKKLIAPVGYWFH